MGIPDRKRKRKAAGCGSCLMALLVTTLIGGGLLTAVGGYIYYVKVPQWRKEIGPFLKRQGQSILGRWALMPIHNVIEKSDMTKTEKKDWSDYIENKWTVAFESTDTELEPETIVDLSRKAIHSHAGYYYAIMFLRDDMLELSTLSDKQQDMADDLFTQVMDNIRAGKYSLNQLKPIYSKLVRLNGGWRTTEKSGKKKETFNALRNVCRYLDDLVKSGEFEGNGKEIDLAVQIREKLEAMKQGIEKAAATPCEDPVDPEKISAWRIFFAVFTNALVPAPEDEIEVPEDDPVPELPKPDPEIPEQDPAPEGGPAPKEETVPDRDKELE